MMRPRPVRDWETAYEVFFQRAYAFPANLEPGTVQRVIDLGGNVGYSCLFFARLCPNAVILTFEPHPVHAALLREHVRLNSLADRIHLVEAAAGVAEIDCGYLSDNDVNSAVKSGPLCQGLSPSPSAIFLQPLAPIPSMF